MTHTASDPSFPTRPSPPGASSSGGGAGTDDPVAPGLERQIDENLRRLYRSRVEEQLPDELLDLVARLRDAGGQS
ncbi:MAG: NepR family anti-sigma factor [Alkalilacustris sp.]